MHCRSKHQLIMSCLPTGGALSISPSRIISDSPSSPIRLKCGQTAGICSYIDLAIVRNCCPVSFVGLILGRFGNSDVDAQMQGVEVQNTTACSPHASRKQPCEFLLRRGSTGLFRMIDYFLTIKYTVLFMLIYGT
jgi:hypothetical protein